MRGTRTRARGQMSPGHLVSVSVSPGHHHQAHSHEHTHHRYITVTLLDICSHSKKVQPKNRFLVTLLDLTWGIENLLGTSLGIIGIRTFHEYHRTEAQDVLWTDVGSFFLK